MSAGPDDPGQQVLLVFSTAPPAVARDLARRLVEERLCACVQVLDGARSFFRWHGAVDEAEEAVLLCKTTAAAFSRLRERLVELHPYDLPEVVAARAADGLPAYLAWVAAELRPPAE